MWKARFRSLIIGLLIVGSGGTAQARPERTPTPSTTIVYFVDGTRMEVRAFEIQGEIVVLMTLDGKLESVPRLFVDLELTRRKEEASGQRPETRGQRSEASGKTKDGGEKPEASGQRAPGPSSPTRIDGPSAPVPPDMIHRDDQGQATMRAVRLEAPLVLDGKLDESVYRRIVGVGGFLQAEPDEGAPATEKTEAWVLFDDDNLYIVGRCWDSHPERMVANEMRRDNFGIYLNDNFAVVLDTFHDKRNAFFFYTNPVGGLFDGLITDERDVNRDWNTVWDAKTGRFENGWTVEMAIPFKSLRYGAAGPQVWGINFRRIVRSKNEFSYLTQIPAAFGGRGVTQISFAGTLVGLETPPKSNNLEIKPYVAGEAITDREADPVLENELDGDFGFDVKYGLTRSLIADFTYNTDFAQVEIDEQQINLTRFNLFLPEKREFFLEGRGIFQFGGIGSPRPQGGSVPNNTPIVFYTRRIGLQESEVIPILAGGRLTGRVGPYSIGALSISTKEVQPADALATNFSVLRFKRDILRRSAIGVIGTLRSPSVDGDGNNSVFGVDASFSFYDNLNIIGYYALSDTPGLDGDSASYLGQFDLQPDLYGIKVERLVVQPGFNPEVGFTRREDFQRNFGELRFSRRPGSVDAIRKLSLIGGFNYTTDNQGTLETRVATAAFRLELENSDQFNAIYANNYEFLPEEFEISDGIFLPSKGYDFRNIRMSYQFGPQRRISGSLSVQTGGFFNGKRTEVGYNGRVEVSPQFSIEPRLSLNWVDLEEGDFTTNLIGGRFNYTFSPRTVLSALVQYFTGDNSFSSNVRFHWEYQPGSDLFVVYSDSYDTFGTGFALLQNRSFVVKFTKLFRF